MKPCRRSAPSWTPSCTSDLRLCPRRDGRPERFRQSARGEAAPGIVYATDAAAEPNVKIVAAFPDDSHPPILYPIAITAGSKNPEAAKF